MDAYRIAKQVEQERQRKERAARRDDERAAAQIARAKAEGSRIELIEDDDGAELRVHPRRLAPMLSDRSFELGNSILPFMLLLPASGIIAAIATVLPVAGLLAGIAVVAGLAAYIHRGISYPLRIRMTRDGHVALWHKRPKRPNWVGRKTDFAVWLGAFDRIHPQSKFWDKRHGWVSIVLLLPDKPLYRCGSPYFLNYDDSKAVYHFLEKHGINVSNCGTT